MNNDEQQKAYDAHYQTLRSMIFDACAAIRSEYFPAGGIVNPTTGLSIFRDGNILSLVRDKSGLLKFVLRATATITEADLGELGLGCCQLLEMDTKGSRFHDVKTMLIIMAGVPEKLGACFSAYDTMKSKHRPAGEELYRVQAAFWAFQTLTSHGHIQLPQGTEVLVRVTDDQMTTIGDAGDKVVKLPKGAEMVVLGGEFVVRSVSRSEFTMQAKKGTIIDPTL